MPLMRAMLEWHASYSFDISFYPDMMTLGKLWCLSLCSIGRYWQRVLCRLVLAVSPALAIAAEPIRVLHIDSYERGYAWSESIDEGLREYFAEVNPSVELSTEYLDSRRMPSGAQLEPLAAMMEVKYALYRPQLVIVSDNAAFDFVIRFRKKLFEDIPIVFCGFNNFQPDVLNGFRNITGVSEAINIEETVEIALKTHPATTHMVFITSTDNHGDQRDRDVVIRTIFPKYGQRFRLEELRDTSLSVAQARLQQLPATTLLFLVGQIRGSIAGRPLTPEESGRLITASSAFPAYALWDFYLNNGVLGGHVITGKDQGRAAAGLAQQILSGTSADSIPVVMTSPASNIFDYKVMKRFGIEASDLPLHSIILNQPYSIWRNHRQEIIITGILFLLETLLLLVLTYNIRARRIAMRELADERAMLEKRVQERTQELQAANDKLSELSFIDSLTLLPNRRHFDEVLEAELHRQHRTGAPLSLILLDIDYFKDYNDHRGHVAGDECLRRVGWLIRNVIHRSSDLPARYGGEEFAVILPETAAAGAVNLAELLREGIAALGIAHPASHVARHVTASLGVITISGIELVSAKTIIRYADEMLYQAKAQGRNQVVAEDRH